MSQVFDTYYEDNTWRYSDSWINSFRISNFGGELPIPTLYEEDLEEESIRYTAELRDAFKPDEFECVLAYPTVQAPTTPSVILSRASSQCQSTKLGRPQRYMTGLRLIIAVLGLGISVFLPSLEVSIVSTSLVTISNDLDGYDQSSWVITAYLLTYTGFLPIWSKISEVIGYKPALMGALIVFTAFSGGCGAAHSIVQLIICRAFQGIGGSGIYTVTTIGYVHLVPPAQYNQIMSIASFFMSMGMVFGPLIGGALNEAGEWHWVFYLNIPAGIMCLITIYFIIPSRFPHHYKPKSFEKTHFWRFNLSVLKRADLCGSLLLLGASILLVAALEEGNVRFPWKSATIISFFGVSGLLWMALLLWEKFASRATSKIEPILPWHLFCNRVYMGVLLGCFLSGAPLTIAIIELPQRYQLVNDSSPLEAGVQLLAYAVSSPVGIVTTTVITSRFRIPYIFTLLFGIVLQTTGFALLSTVSNTLDIWAGQYGYSVLAGLGTGFSIASLYVLAPVVVDKKDQTIAIGTTLQARYLGGAVGIAIVNSVLIDHVRPRLSSILSSEQLGTILQSASRITQLSPAEENAVRVVYGEGYNWQMRTTIAFCAAHVLSVAMIWKKKPLRVNKEGITE